MQGQGVGQLAAGVVPSVKPDVRVIGGKRRPKFNDPVDKRSDFLHLFSLFEPHILRLTMCMSLAPYSHWRWASSEHDIGAGSGIGTGAG